MRRLLTIVIAVAACGGSEAGAPADPDAAEEVPDARPADVDAAIDFPAPSLDDCITDGSAGEHRFDCGGLTYDVSVPAICLTRACGLIVDVHGYSMSAAQQDNNTRMRALGRDRGYIVIQPNAQPAPPLSDWTALDDDDIFAFVERVAAAYHVDPRRWYFTGFSQGGFMSWRFACNYADRFAAIAPLAGCSMSGANACVLGLTALPGETNILYAHGSRDTIVSGSCRVPQRRDLLAAYDLAGPIVLSEDDDHRWTRWTNPRGVTFEMIEHDYSAGDLFIAGHCFPGSDDPGTEPGQVSSFACAGPTAFDWGTAVVDFFDRHVGPAR